MTGMTTQQDVIKVVDTETIDDRLPAGQMLVMVTGTTVHLAFREQPHHGWPKGCWLEVSE